MFKSDVKAFSFVC